MEGKKVLWVVFSIALVLVVVLAGGLFLLRPRQARPAEAAPGQAPSIQGYDPYEYVRGPSETPGLAPSPAEPQPSVIVVGEKPGSAPAPSVEAQASPPAGEPVRPVQPAVAVKPAEVRPESRPEARPEPRPAVRPAVKPAAAPKPGTVRVTEYWIQAGSFSSASRADEVTRSLEEKGLAARTSTRDLDGKTRFRVRIGPYSSRDEAEKFLAWVQELKGFETSYISMVASRRAMP